MTDNGESDVACQRWCLLDRRDSNDEGPASKNTRGTNLLMMSMVRVKDKGQLVSAG